ncbi:unnamed protein product, partial [Mesorhabditis belari]|uniref:Uncharacterized protein n=1 Tax=Mesorhabditis belari TaxID=2138241 RepID=A0AAF3EVT7_9BILA
MAEDDAVSFSIGVTDILLWIWSLLPFEIKSYVWMWILTILGIILLILCCCGICFCAPPCICAVWLEKRRRRKNADKKAMAFVTEKRYLREPSAPPLLNV